MNFIIRQERKEDYRDTEEVVRRAFENETYSDQSEHTLVAKLRKSEVFVPDLSLVAVNEDKIIGHILLSKIWIDTEDKKVESLALAPISVLPEYQNKGVGRKLIQQALTIAEKLDFESVIVMGHEAYYPKFGFKKASHWGIQAPFEIPDELLMAIELKDNSLDHVSGVIQYSNAFFE
ncbi:MULTISPECIES: GNAT family N-acetyltransferase [Staphylococcus]|jgi:predicted N-acetyltransferase YhbS|uniref:GNAT family N-acetyltransferase n=1 Tax=Staphylococcus TaxID=1279 RepID=UPI0002463931|nr:MULTISPECIES: N-acetyltransferase [Staphylococcus]QAV30726.1 N-acetyltransferase [Sulfitobacter donghicola]AGZ25577.1 GNAT family acetyltransferase [Staphylococcus pasteuri SP1]KAB7644778.1 N-acetyltransferase [Staphylococcus sp. B2-b]MBN6853301.1 N-acetyltransferase [Staphylococcus warneri]MBT2770060.1 N-acetyltransferase [Staphylococcus warneri]